MEIQSNFTTLDNCEHDVIIEGFCDNCGLEVGPRIDMESNFIDNYMISTRNEPKNYNTEINKIDVSEQVKTVISESLNKTDRSVKGVTRELDVFCHAYLASAELNELQPEKALKSLNITSKNLNKSLRIISGTDKKVIKDNEGQVITCPIVSISPIECLKEICTKIEYLKPHQDDIQKLIQTMLRKSPTLLNEKPKHIAIGFIKCYCKRKKIPIKDFIGQMDISEATINQYSSKINKLIDMHDIVI